VTKNRVKIIAQIKSKEKQMAPKSMADRIAAVRGQYETRETAKREQEERYQASSEKVLPLETGKEIVLRVLDVPVERHSSFIKDDEDKWLFAKFPGKDKDPNGDFILSKIAAKVLARTKNGKDSSGKAIYTYHNETAHSTSFWIVRNNGNDQVGKYGPSGWVKDSGYPGSDYLFNVINRQEFTMKSTDKDGVVTEEVFGPNWCYDNKHSLILAKKDKYAGVTWGVWDKITNEFHGNFGSYLEYDICIKKLSAKPWYELSKASTLTGIPAVMDIAKDGALTDEELAIEMYDLEEMVKQTPNLEIYNRMKGKIDTIDKDMNTDFLGELESLVRDEDGFVEAKQPAAQRPAATNSMTSPEAEAPVEETPVEETPTREAPPTREAVKEEAPSEDIHKVAPFLKTIDESSIKELVKGVKDGELEYTTTKVALCTEANCKKSQPLAWAKSCVYCGKSF
jgi:hypothetical protein